MVDIYWIIDDSTEIAVVKVQDQYAVVDLNDARVCIISHGPQGRMLFDGEDIDTEDFMAFVGMLDTVNDSPKKRVLFNSDMTVVDL